MSNKEISAHVLIAEDNKSDQLLLKISLEEMGISCDLADNGVEAVEMFSQKHYDLVLMDINMPELNGLEATQQIRRKYFSNVPIIAVTVNVEKGSAERVLKMGMDDYIPKPVDHENLLKVIQKYLG